MVENMRNKSPKESVKTLFTALKDGDDEIVKSSLSNRSIELIEVASETQNITFKEALKDFGLHHSENLPETRNQAIKGDMAFIDVKNSDTGKFKVFVFIRENDAWKLAVDHIVLSVELNMVEKFFNNIKNLFGDCIDLLKTKP
jgi:hypothetical protein